MTIDNWFNSAYSKFSSALSSPPPSFPTNSSFTPKENIELHTIVLSKPYGIPLVYYWKNEKQFTELIPKTDIPNRIDELNSEGHKLHLSVNTPSGQRLIKNIKTMNSLAADIDTTHRNQPATTEQKQETLSRVLRLQNFLKQKYGLISFIVDSGNGYHLYIPIGSLEIPEGKQTEFNEKSKAFWNKTKTETDINIDHCSDINRVLTLAGSTNTKYPDKPMLVFFLNPDNLSFDEFKKRIEESKPHNLAIIQTIFETLEVDLTKTNKPISRSWSDRKCRQKAERGFASPEDIFSKQQNSLDFCMAQDFKLAEILNKELVVANGNQGSDDFQLIRRLDFFNFGEAEKIAIFMKYRVYLPDGQPREKFRLASVDYYLDRLLRSAVSDTHFGDREREIPLWV